MMRLAATAKRDEYNVWLTDDELDQVCRTATTARDDLICQLGGYVGLRAFEIPQICPTHVSRTDDGEHYQLRVPSGKDTTGNGGKPLDAGTHSRIGVRPGGGQIERTVGGHPTALRTVG